MSKRLMLIANWKMHFTVAEAGNYARELAADLYAFNDVDIVLCPHFLALADVRAALSGSGIYIGAQDAHWAERGAHTGQISAHMLRGLVDYVILGHSETRAQLGVDDEGVRLKLAAVLANELRAIVCIGESEAEYSAGQSASVLRSQITTIFATTPAIDLARVVIAYEPIWAIGTGHMPRANAVNQLVAEAIRAPLTAQFGKSAASAIHIVYGGSIAPTNLVPFTIQPQLDGALVGGASLNRDIFIELASIAQEAYTP